MNEIETTTERRSFQENIYLCSHVIETLTDQKNCNEI